MILNGYLLGRYVEHSRNKLILKFLLTFLNTPALLLPSTPTDKSIQVAWWGGLKWLTDWQVQLHPLWRWKHSPSFLFAIGKRILAYVEMKRKHALFLQDVMRSFFRYFFVVLMRFMTVYARGVEAVQFAVWEAEVFSILWNSICLFCKRNVVLIQFKTRYEDMTNIFFHNFRIISVTQSLYSLGLLQPQ